MGFSSDLFCKISSIVTLTITYSIIFTSILAAPTINDDRTAITLIDKVKHEIQQPCGEPKLSPIELPSNENQIVKYKNIRDLIINMQKLTSKLNDIVQKSSDLKKFLGNKGHLLSDLQKMSEIQIKNCDSLNIQRPRNVVKNKQLTPKTLQDLRKGMAEHTFIFKILNELNTRKSEIKDFTNPKDDINNVASYLNSALCSIEHVMNESIIAIEPIEDRSFQRLFEEAQKDAGIETNPNSGLIGIDSYHKVIEHLNTELENLLAIQENQCA